MLRTRLWVLVCLLAGAGQALLFGCGDDEGTSSGHGGSTHSSAGGEGASEAVAGNFTDSPLAGSSTQNPGGGAGGVDASITPTGGVGLGGSAAGAGGASEPKLGEQLELCARLSGLTTHAFNVEQAYAKAAIKDCRVSWVIPRKDELVPFQNELVVWNLELWGCQGKPVESFALVFGTPTLSQGDAAILIDLYMTAAKNDLELSPPEFAELKAALERLAQPLLDSPSSEPSQPNCPVEMGGAGGAAGSGGSTDGGVGGVLVSAGQGGMQ
jgi:hypothetical protein